MIPEAKGLLHHGQKVVGEKTSKALKEPWCVIIGAKGEKNAHFLHWPYIGYRCAMASTQQNSHCPGTEGSSKNRSP